MCTFCALFLRIIRNRKKSYFFNYLYYNYLINYLSLLESIINRKFLPYKQGVTGSNPVSPTNHEAPFEREARFVFSHLYIICIFSSENTPLISVSDNQN